tara:strand:- start:52 stop:711 length:660 start_codon:yes stop_codon:yes gene_type:complete
MGILTILGTVGKAILGAVIPSLGDKLIEKVNEFVEPDKRLDPKKATGEEVAEAVRGLPPETQNLIIESEVAKQVAEFKFESHIDDNSVKLRLAHLENEKNGAWVRPFVVIMMTILVMFGLGCAIWTNGYIAYKAMGMFEAGGVGVAEVAQLTALNAVLPDYTSWAVILSFPVWVIRSYFGDRTEDKRTKANMQVGVPTEPKATLGGSIGSVITKKILKL